MSICKECGSEVTTVDQFCPFCGIRMEAAAEKEVTPVPTESDAEMDSTLVVSPAKLEQMRAQAAAQATPAEDPPVAPDTVETRTTSPSLPTDPSILADSVPTPAILSSEPVPPSNVPLFTEPAAEYVPEMKVEEKPAVEEMEEAPAIPEKPVEPVVLSEAEAETDVEPPAEISEPIMVEPEPEDQQDEPATIMQPVVVDELRLDNAPKVLDEVANEVKPEPLETSEPPRSNEAEGIGMPEEDLEIPERAPSVFDSVRIIEGELPDMRPNSRLSEMEAPTVIPGMPAAPAASEAVAETPATGAPLGAEDTDGRKASKLKPLPEGTMLNGRYEIVRKIGGGGMGAVYLASDNNLGGVLRAVKEMVQAHIEEEQQEKAINDFKRESMILSTLDHPSIPTIFDYFYDAEEGRFYLVMKYISGGDLSGKLRAAPEGKIDELTVTEWAIQITDVLNYLHNQPSTIVYRDLKPSNLMLDGNTSRIMLIDFGIARSISQKEEKGVTAVGTMGYAPPELFSGNVEPRSDIYSLGSTMFHLLTGADPQSNPLLIFDFQKNPRPRQINPRLSDQMERILMKSVEYNADGRYSTAAEMKAILEEHLANLRSGNLTFGVTEAPISVSLANQSVFCGFCGQRIVATDLFCAFCGAKQPLAQQGVHSEIYQKSSMTARLVVEGTSDLSAPVYALQKDDNLIGRRDPMSNIFPEVDLSKYDPQTKISRRHAKIWRDGGTFMLEDLGSSNGTVIEGAGAAVFRLAANQPYKLSSGDRIKIGDTRLHFVVG